MKKELWLRIRQYHFDHLVPPHLSDRVVAAFRGADASTQAFAGKLGRKLGWKRDFALRAIHEYKKFVYLGVATGVDVTPSKVIDQVWHEHLLFTRAYRDFCRDVLGRDFDHHPELMQSHSQTAHFQQQFTRTIDAYQFEFDRLPPADIWGTPKFTADQLAKDSAASRRARAARERSRDERAGSDVGSEPLHSFFGSSGAGSSGDASVFGGGGGFSGGGSGDSWDGPATSDSGSSDSSSSDSGSSDSGGSSCSSSCGGGGD